MCHLVRKEGRQATATLVITASTLLHVKPVEGLGEPIPGDIFLFFTCALEPPVARWAIQVPVAAVTWVQGKFCHFRAANLGTAGVRTTSEPAPKQTPAQCGAAK